MLKLNLHLFHFVMFGIRDKLTFILLVALALLCGKKKLNFFLYFIHYIFLLQRILLFGFGNSLDIIQFSPYITFYVWEGGVKTILPKSIWVLKIPIKNKFFLWMTLHNKILTKDNLRKRGWSGDQNCVFCTSPESVDHLFFHYPFVVDFWSQLLASHPQRRHIHLSSLLDFWNSYFLFSDFQVWGTLLVASI
jgi:zinc-binding in reverse transcriptase